MVTTKLNDLFDQMENEKGDKLDDKIQVEESDPDVDHLIQVLKGLPNKHNQQSIESYLSKNITKSYTSKQITKFSMLLTDEMLKDMEYFRTHLSWLINSSEDETHNIYTNHLSYKIDNLFQYLNRKKLHVYGDVGDGFGRCMVDSEFVLNGNAGAWFGSSMSSGKAIIKGNCGGDAGAWMEDGLIDILGNSHCSVGYSMYGGKIIVRGNVEESLGISMAGGTIIVEGNCKSEAAEHMRGGEIIIKGDTGRNVGYKMGRGVVKIYGNIESLSKTIFGGDIYHKGKQIVRNGEILDKSYLK